ncbi:hypothetical protein CLV92_12023 [Kineococcus xinjiangensis]|uniref:Uncharacterized protein n=1 Tax=Kineococcus xinjiangensis TaxID=512762 RepID=A0A2S6ICF2_9ACTN|nr:hypothetical protein [Kineococcus xinjiangensis]PPK91904.1 hypothetical protein CLV92_12023 [Kineococcus xinjiangensis]
MSTQQPTEQTTPDVHQGGAGVAARTWHYDGLSESLQAALYRWAGSPERQDAWTEHVFTLAAAPPCTTCRGPVGLCGGHDDTGQWWCRTCIQRRPGALHGRRLRSFSCDIEASLSATAQTYREKSGDTRSHDCLAYALTTRVSRNGRLGGEATVQANCRRAHEVLQARMTPGNNPLARRKS